MSRKPKPGGSRKKAPRTQAEVIEALRRQGMEPELTNGDHYRVKTPGGIVVFSQTPSDHRAILNNISVLRRNGVKI